MLRRMEITMSEADANYRRGYSKGYAAGKKAADASLQAKIDALMLEYCPNEMTKEQIENWKRHQQPLPQHDEGTK